MIRLGKWLSIPLSVNPAAVPMMLAAMWLGEGKRLAIMSGSILLHEMAHILAARMLHVQVIELELMPIGGAARMENLWKLRAGQMIAVALAGPLCNLLLMVTAAALCWWGMMEPWLTAALIEQNAMIVGFNLLPALPLDGGRILCGILERRMSADGAARVGVRVSCALAACMMGLSIYGLCQGHLNITLPAAALFLAVSAQKEKRQATASAIASWMGRANELRQEKARVIRWLAVDEGATVYDVVMRMKPGYVHRIAVYDGEMRLREVLEESEIMPRMIEDHGQKLLNLPGKHRRHERGI